MDIAMDIIREKKTQNLLQKALQNPLLVQTIIAVVHQALIIILLQAMKKNIVIFLIKTLTNSTIPGVIL
jgi:hypothetical protein